MLPLLSVLAVLIAAPAAPEEGCPSARQVTEAMQGRFPAYLVFPDQLTAIARPDVLHSIVDAAPDGTVVRFTLLDARGETQLRRTLPAAARTRPISECVALAETMAAIVERYLSSIAYDAGEPGAAGAADAAVVDPVRDVAAQAPINPAPRPRTAVAVVGVGWRATSGGRGPQDGLDIHVGGQLEVTRTLPRLAILLSVGASQDISAPLSDSPMADTPRTASLRRFPLRVGALLELPAGPGWVEPSLNTGGDLLLLSATAGTVAPAAPTTVRFSPVIEAGVGYRLKVSGRFFLRPGIVIGAALKRYDTGVENETGVGPLATPWTYASFGIDTAAVFQ